MELIEKLKWRYAAKRMNGETVAPEKLDNILEAIRLSASSAGIQPYKVIVVSDPETKARLKAVANNQPQLTEASHVLVFTAWDKVTQEHIDNYIQSIATERGVSTESLADFRDKLSFFVTQDAASNFTWASRQTYIALGTALIAAAYEAVDATPMEGFSNDGVDEVLGLRAKGLKSVSILTLGYRDAANDWNAPLKKVRRSKEELFELV